MNKKVSSFKLGDLVSHELLEFSKKLPSKAEKAFLKASHVAHEINEIINEKKSLMRCPQCNQEIKN